MLEADGVPTAHKAAFGSIFYYQDFTPNGAFSKFGMTHVFQK
jgi:hypothetical protein